MYLRSKVRIEKPSWGRYSEDIYFDWKMNEQSYIRYRIIKAKLASLCYFMCRLFPIDNNLISVCTFEGKGGFGCNPKYLVQAIHKNRPDLRFVWIVNDTGKEFPKYIKKVPNSLWNRAYWLSRSRVWIDNYRKPYGTVKRKGQYYLNVNHFTIGIKCTGLLRGKGFSKMAYLVNKNDSDMIDGLVIDSEWCRQCFGKAMVYNGNMLKTGSPRCDILYGDRSESKQRFRKKHGLPENTKIIMFAPTFREGSKNGKRFVFSETWSVDFVRLIWNLEKKFGGNWYICLRVHPQLAAGFKDYHDPAIDDRLIDESNNDDMYEVLAGMDAYITDYSSAIFEAGFAHIPAFIYADDIKDYGNVRGNLYWNMATERRKNVENNRSVHSDMDLTLPYTVAKDNDQLEEDILGFNEKEYKSKLDEFHNRIGLVFDGNASERLSGIVLNEMKKRKP